jgi:hypothetical protein
MIYSYNLQTTGITGYNGGWVKYNGGWVKSIYNLLTADTKDL